MSAILDLAQSHHIQHFAQDEAIVEQGTSSGRLYVLVGGEVGVPRDDVLIAKISQPGSVFGEISALLGVAHTATVRALMPSAFAVIDDPRTFLESSSQASLEVAELLAHRVDALTKYLIDMRRQYEGHEHFALVDEVLDALMHRSPQKRNRF